jgi:hypothetical protein
MGEEFSLGDTGPPLESAEADCPPSAGGCWFCHSDGAEGFSWGFDAFFHYDCAEELGIADRDDPVLAYERGDAE